MKSDFILNNKLKQLSESVFSRISEKRAKHTLGVAKCAAILSEALLPDKVEDVCAAAILHDVAKELPDSEQINMLRENGIELSDEDINTSGVLHSFSAPIIIKKDYPEFANEEILSAVYNHTLGKENMSLFDKIIFLSDYIEENRTFESCIKVRNMTFEGFFELSYRDKLKRIDKCTLAAIDGALEALRRMNRPINSKMFITRDYILKNLL